MKTKPYLTIVTRGAGRSLFLLAATIGLLASPLALRAAAISDVLEQGIYSEETKGDLVAAITAYQQVVQDAKASQSLAAQAQYRLGVCYYKQGKYNEAETAFEKVVNNYPDQKELVRMASNYLADAVNLLPAPWADGEEMELDIKTQTGFKLGFARYTVYSDTVDGQKIWRLGSSLIAGARQVSEVRVDADTFKPIESHWKQSVLGEAEAVYSDGRVEVKMTGQEQTKTTELEGVAYDNEEVIQLIRRLPLGPDHRATLRVFTSLGGSKIIPFELEVRGLESITVPAGTFECYKVHLNLVDQTFWYSADEHRYLVKFDAGAITAELTGVEQRTAGELKRRETTAFDFKLGEAGGGVPTIADQNSQPPQNQAKLLILTTARLGKVPVAANWCDDLNKSGARFPGVPTNTVFALNAAVAGRSLSGIPADTVIYFETASRGWNQTGGAEMLANNDAGVAVAFADGRALLVDPAGRGKLRWNP